MLDVVIGEDAGDPVFCVTDLLPHLAKDQMTKTLSEGIKGEQLNVVVGSRPYPDEKVKEKIKLNILSLLHEKYGLVRGRLPLGRAHHGSGRRGTGCGL